MMAMTYQVDALHWTDLGAILPEGFPVTKKEKMQRMKDAGWTEPGEAHRQKVRYHAHEHALKANAHREKLGKMMGLPAKIDYYAAGM